MFGNSRDSCRETFVFNTNTNGVKEPFLLRREGRNLDEFVLRGIDLEGSLLDGTSVCET